METINEKVRFEFGFILIEKMITNLPFSFRGGRVSVTNLKSDGLGKPTDLLIKRYFFATTIFKNHKFLFMREWRFI